MWQFDWYVFWIQLFLKLDDLSALAMQLHAFFLEGNWMVARVGFQTTNMIDNEIKIPLQKLNTIRFQTFPCKGGFSFSTLYFRSFHYSHLWVFFGKRETITNDNHFFVCGTWNCSNPLIGRARWLISAGIFFSFHLRFFRQKVKGSTITNYNYIFLSVKHETAPIHWIGGARLIYQCR